MTTKTTTAVALTALTVSLWATPTAAKSPYAPAPYGHGYGKSVISERYAKRLVRQALAKKTGHQRWTLKRNAEHTRNPNRGIKLYGPKFEYYVAKPIGGRSSVPARVFAAVVTNRARILNKKILVHGPEPVWTAVGHAAPKGAKRVTMHD